MCRELIELEQKERLKLDENSSHFFHIHLKYFLEHKLFIFILTTSFASFYFCRYYFHLTPPPPCTSYSFNSSKYEMAEKLKNFVFFLCFSCVETVQNISHFIYFPFIQFHQSFEFSFLICNVLFHH